jgi:hypothetical protein
MLDEIQVKSGFTKFFLRRKKLRFYTLLLQQFRRKFLLECCLLEEKSCVHWLLLAIANAISFDEDFCLLGCDALSIDTCISEEPASSLSRVEQEAECFCGTLVPVYQSTWGHTPDTAVLTVTSARTSNIIVMSVFNNLIPTLLCYSTEK